MKVRLKTLLPFAGAIALVIMLVPAPARAEEEPLFVTIDRDYLETSLSEVRNLADDPLGAWCCGEELRAAEILFLRAVARLARVEAPGAPGGVDPERLARDRRVLEHESEAASAILLATRRTGQFLIGAGAMLGLGTTWWTVVLVVVGFGRLTRRPRRRAIA